MKKLQKHKFRSMAPHNGQGLSLRVIWAKYSPEEPKFRPILVSGRSGSLPKKKNFFFFF